MKPPAERDKLVTDFGELKVAMIVVVKPCGWCGGKHRGMLTAFYPQHLSVNHAGEETVGPAWRRDPPAPHAAVKNLWSVIVPRNVANRRVYRVLTGVEDDQAHATTKKRAPREHAK